MGVVGSNKTSSNERLETGSVALDASNPTTVTTGLSTITACGATLQGSAAPGLGTSIVTALKANVVDASTVALYAWKVTGAGDTTLIASTGTETVDWWATGY